MGNAGVSGAQTQGGLPDRNRRETNIDRLKGQLSRIDERKQLLVEAIAQHEAAKFKVGDPVILPEVGVVLISEVYVPAEIKLNDEISLCSPNKLTNSNMEEPDLSSGIHYRVGSPLLYDIPILPESKLLPLNSASQTLYGKK